MMPVPVPTAIAMPDNAPILSIPPVLLHVPPVAVTEYAGAKGGQTRLGPDIVPAKGNGFTTSINQFAEEHAVDLIITIPKHHGLLDSLFTTSHTTKLAFHSHLPLMVIHK